MIQEMSHLKKKSVMKELVGAIRIAVEEALLGERQKEKNRQL